MNPRRGERFGTLPNFLTLLRIVFVPALILIGMSVSGNTGTFGNRFLSFCGGLVILLAAISDVLDGYLARKWKSVSRWGVLFDPLADKLVVLTALVMLIPLDRGVPAWAVALFIIREMAVTCLRGFAASEEIFIEAAELGKSKVTLQYFALGLIFLYYPYFGVNWHAVGLVFFWLALPVTLLSGVVYFYRFFKEDDERRKRTGA